MTDGGKAVVFLHARLKRFKIHTGLLREFLEARSLHGPTRLFRSRPFLLEVRQLRRHGHHDAHAQVDPLFLDHVVQSLLVIHDPHRAADAFQRITCKRPIEHDRFVAEAAALRIKPQVRLLGGSRHVVRGTDSLGPRTIRRLHFGAVFAGARIPSHVDAVARLAGLRETVHAGEAHVLLHHLRIGTEAARCNDDGSRLDGDLVAVVVFSHDAHDLAVLLNEALRGRFEKELLPHFRVLLLEEVDPTGAAPFINVPRIKAARIVRIELFKLHAVALHPVDGGRRLFKEGTHHARISAPVAVVHDHLEGLVFREVVVPVALHGTFDCHDAFGEIAGAADGRLLFKGDDLRARFRRRQSRGRTGRTGTDHDDVGRHGDVFGHRDVHREGQGTCDREGGRTESECSSLHGAIPYDVFLTVGLTELTGNPIRFRRSLIETETCKESHSLNFFPSFS